MPNAPNAPKLDYLTDPTSPSTLPRWSQDTQQRLSQDSIVNELSPQIFQHLLQQHGSPFYSPNKTLNKDLEG